MRIGEKIHDELRQARDDEAVEGEVRRVVVEALRHGDEEEFVTGAEFDFSLEWDGRAVARELDRFNFRGALRVLFAKREGEGFRAASP